MPSCIVKGCKHHTSTKSSNPLLTMHVFPRELGRIRLWLQQTGQDFGDIDAFAAKILEAAKSGKYRICSAHFEPGCYSTIGCRLVLKYDAIPTIFPGISPKPSSDWRPFPLEAQRPHLGLDVLGSPQFHESVSTSRVSFPKKDAATQTNKESHPILNTSLMEKRNKQEEIFDANGRLVGVFSPDSKQRDLKIRPGLWTYDWSTQIPEEPSTTQPSIQNKEALFFLEKVLVSLLKHMAEVPHTRPQKQRTSRLLNRTAEIISILTGEEWTVVKKNAHISKFYKMIREVPIKCGDVAMFFTMDEWDYIEEHEDRYKPVMLESPKDDTANAKDACSNAVPGQTKGKPVTCRLLRSSINHPTVKEEHGAIHLHGERAKTPLPLIPEKVAATIKEEEDVEVCGTEIPPDISTAAHRSVSPPVPRMDPSTEVYDRQDTVIDFMDSGSSELWIAQDGTTSSFWMPQEDPRPPGWSYKTYSRKPRLLQCPVSLTRDSAPNLKGNRSRKVSAKAKRPRARAEHRCDQCDQHFSNRQELSVHGKTHTKKQRLTPSPPSSRPI